MIFFMTYWCVLYTTRLALRRKYHHITLLSFQIFFLERQLVLRCGCLPCFLEESFERILTRALSVVHWDNKFRFERHRELVCLCGGKHTVSSNRHKEYIDFI